MPKKNNYDGDSVPHDGKFTGVTQEQSVETDKFIDWYRSSWNDKAQRGLFDLWEMAFKYWEGDVNQPVDDIDPGSETNIIHPNTEGEVAFLVEQNLQINLIGNTPADHKYADICRIILSWVVHKNKMKRKLDVHERRRKLFGTCGWRVLFDPDAIDGFGLPVIDYINPAYVFFDPNITDIYKIQDGEFVIEPVNKSIYWARRKFGDEKADRIEPGYNPIEDELDFFGEKDGESDEKSMANYVHLYIWTRNDKDKLRLVQMTGCGVILSDSDEEGEDSYFPNNKFPYFMTPLYFREGTIWGKGDAELLIGTQDLINDLDDQIRINARLTGNPQKVVSTSSGLDIDKITNEPGLIIPVKGDVKGIQNLNPSEIPNYIVDRRRYALEYEAVKQTRFSDQQTGMPQKGVDTATEVLALQQSAQAGVNHKKLLLEETMSEMMEYVLEMVMEFYTVEHAFTITDKEDAYLWFKPSTLKSIPVSTRPTIEYANDFVKKNKKIPKSMILMAEDEKTPETKIAEFDIRVKIGAGLPNNPAFRYKMMMESFDRQIIPPDVFLNWMVENMGLPVDIKDIQEKQRQQQAMAQQQAMEQQVQPNKGAKAQTMPNANVEGMSANNRPGGITA